jgi:hypothetical protein
VRTLVKIVPLGLAVAAALSIGSNANAQSGLPSLAIAFSFSGTPSLSVEHVTPGNSSSGASIESVSLGGSGGGPSPAPPARVVVDPPAGYAPDLTAAPGTPVGIAFASASNQSGSAFSTTTIAGAVTAQDPAQYQSNAAAQACAPGPYLAVWSLDTGVLGLFKTSLPIFLVRPAGSATGVELRFCAPTLTNPDGTPVAAPPLPLDGLSLLLSTLTPPTAAGSYEWHAYVAPQTPGTGAPNDPATYELRSIVPVPHAITVKGSYNAKLHDAVLTGRVTEDGKAQARASVFAVTTSSLEPIRTRTSAAGRFTIRARIAQTTTFFLQVPDQTGPCTGATTAPGGCLSTTVSATATKTVRVVVPRR